METESWLVLTACALLTFYLLWKLHSANTRINEIRTSSYVALKQDSSVFRQLDETSKQLAEKDRYIAHLAENVSELNDTRSTNKRLEEEKTSLEVQLSAEKEYYQNEVNAFLYKQSEHEKELYQAKAEITRWQQEAQEISKLKIKNEAKAYDAAVRNSKLANEIGAWKERYDTLHKTNDFLITEKSKLQREIEKLKADIQRPQEGSSDTECVICFAQRKRVLLRPCMHVCVCEQCSQRINRCPLCTTQVTAKVLVFL